MAIKSEAGIYQILEDLLRATSDPLTCVDLYEHESVRKHAKDANKVSDFLGHMWRRGLLQRWFAPQDSRAKARFAYTWKVEEERDPQPVPSPSKPRLASVQKPNVTITETNGAVTLDFAEFTITIEPK